MNRSSIYVVDTRKRSGSAVYRTRFEFIARLVCRLSSRLDYGKPGTFFL